ncbi:hypothetical protein [Metapseudomonas otitidis]|uniref:hypothetical protein n=1 Tax=Metapseudomonas otitidis TaxID=319939 RepID=UPI0024491990|nr:hypothetical protein [Pseudomonas otitidis]MDG9785300.1 hypothetical protein [Pseudomonas otitidis]
MAEVTNQEIIRSKAERIAEIESKIIKLVRQHRFAVELLGVPDWSEEALRMSDRIAELEREIERFKSANKSLSEEVVRRRNSAVEARRAASDLMAANRRLWAEAEDTKAERDTLRAELEACRKDAGYWRYIREHFQLDGDVFSTFNKWFWAAGPLEEVEAAIDAAMQEGGV